MASQTSGAAATALAGGLGGAAQVLAEQPLDTVKTRLQSRSAAFVACAGPRDLLRATLTREGHRALMQGFTPRLLTYSLVKFSLFSLYERARAPPHGGHAGVPGLGLSVLPAGALAGGLNTVVSCPQDVLKSRLQMQIVAGGRGYAGPIATARTMLAERGVLAFYSGWRPLLLRDTLGYAVLFSVFESSKAGNWLPLWACGGMSGLAFYISTLPIDRVKTVMMTQPL
jgi:solute carrier family 25 carnitine/acylcarnitine transporter 20/29